MIFLAITKVICLLDQNTLGCFTIQWYTKSLQSRKASVTVLAVAVLAVASRGGLGRRVLQLRRRGFVGEAESRVATRRFGEGEAAGELRSERQVDLEAWPQ
ncbi:unnamed protein product [Linum trigynum]|uniref:Uncharacterized protein n=1 Tax=Linum trigynum TaxID=586398 RepID=A0AAV2GTM5_9ROSI